MERKLIQRECLSSIKAWRGYAEKQRDGYVCGVCGNVGIPPSGRPDYTCNIGAYGFKVEVKAAPKSFVFSGFRDDQREWAKKWVRETGGHYYIWLGMGLRINHKEYPRRTWLIPLNEFLAAEVIMAPYQASIPALAGRGYSKELQRQQLDCYHIFAPWELTWLGKSTWTPRNPMLYPDMMFDAMLA